jgi:hydroxypyruvate isomerase
MQHIMHSSGTVGIVGWTGLVGQTLYYQLLRRGIQPACYNSKNLQEIRGAAFDTLYLCCMPAVKWWANKNPEADRAVLNTVLDALDTVTSNRIVLISTVDVLQPNCGANEESTAWATHAYGHHRRLLEVWVSNKGPSYILRLPALFGRGLKKNALYDLLHDNQVAAISLEARFQWYNLAHLLGDCQRMIQQNLHLLHPISPPIAMRDIVARWFPERGETCVGNAGIQYDMRTKYGSSGYWKPADAVLDEMGAWIAWERWRLSRRIAVSNIGFTMMADTTTQLRHLGVTCLEIAPGKGRDFGGFPVVSMQSVLYGTAIQNIFWESTAFLSHLRKLLEAVGMKGLRIVFGSPRQRHIGTATQEEAVNLFRTIGDLVAEYDATVCIEPNAKGYGCTWLTTIQDALAFVQDVQHPNIRLSLDSGNALMEGDEGWETVPIEWIGHVQISAEHLGPSMDVQQWKGVQKKVESLWRRGYEGAISWEAREHADWWKGCGEFMDMLETTRHFG